MFSQFRQAVETLAQTQLHQSQDAGSSVDVRSQSPDPLRQPTTQSSAQPADNALANLRRSIATQRTATTTGQHNRSRSSSPGPSPTLKSTNDTGLRKQTLEERLRASFVLGDSSGGSTPSPSAVASPAPHAGPVPQRPLSPASTPLPDSPIVPGSPTLPPDASIDASQSEHSDPESTPAGSQDSAASSPDGTTIDSDVKDQERAVIVEPAGESQELIVAEAQPEVPQGTRASEVRPVTVHLPSETGHSEKEDTATAPDPSCTTDADVEVLRERLKLVEQRFANVSTSFKRLQAERMAADNVVTELTPLEGTKDVAALRDYLANVNTKVEISQDELQRLTGKLMRQEERFEELRETHRLETASQSDQIEILQQQLREAESLIAASQASTSQSEEENAKRSSELDALRAEVAKANETAKEEEEKRVKAISLLKTVRQKLVKAEKDRDDALKELNEIKGKGGEEKEREKEERAKLQGEIDVANMEREKAVAGLRAQFDKEIAIAKDRAEKELQGARKQFETEITALKATASYSAEISAKRSQISTLENSVDNLAGENKSFFEQLQLRQAELESSQYHAESLQAENTELQFQLKESQERVGLLTDEVNELRAEQDMRAQVPNASTEEISQIVSSVEAKYETKLSELRRTLTNAEKERTEAEANWSRKFMEKNKEAEDLSRMLRSSAQSRERNEDVTGALKAEIERLQSENRSQNVRLSELQSHVDVMKEAESVLHRRLSEVAGRAEDSEQRLEELKAREAQLRAQNKTLRDELRKVQSSAALLEKQRNPGVGYRTPRTEATDSRTSISSVADAPASSPSSPPPSNRDEEINFEYLRNVILQFLEHKEMRPNLVRVLSIILRFTPQETRRLMAKV